jgi:YfiH family protein
MIHPDWPAPAQVRTLSTTRQGGFSREPWNSFNLAMHVGDDDRAVAANRHRLQQLAALPADPLWLSQVHGNHVVNVASAGISPAADASLSLAPGQVCAVLTADCLPVLFCDRQGTRVAAAHAGWRGLSCGVLEATVASMGTAPELLLAWLGPAIGPAAFEVGDEVRDVFLSAHAAAAHAFASHGRGRWLADLYALARIRLQAAGVTAVYGGGWCTFADPQRFFSYRRDGQTGRMASLIWLS